MKFHSFETALAKRYGINEAIILNSMIYWIEHNAANGKNFFDGYYWTFNTVESWAKQFNYMTTSQIRTTLKSLEKQGAIITGNYNETKYDRTLWYAVKHDVYAICENSKMDLLNLTIPFEQNRKPIPSNIHIDKDISSEQADDDNVLRNTEQEDEVQAVVNKWNETVKLLSKCMRMSQARKRAISARIREYGLDVVLSMIDRVEESEWLSGRGKWDNCSLDWVMSPNNFLKVYEGQYNKQQNKSAACGIGSRYKVVKGDVGNVEYEDKSTLDAVGLFTGDTETS